jgi:Fe-S cluster assembly scaffold protein SufB
VASSVSADAPEALGVGKAALDALLERAETGAIAPGLRRDALARFEELPLHRTIRSSRGWRRDLDKVDLSRLDASAAGADCVAIEISAEAAARGVVAVSLADAARDHAERFSAARGTALDGRDDKFASLALAFQNAGAFVFVPADVRLDEPITIRYAAPAGGLFPYTLIVLETGAAATVIERFEAPPPARSSAASARSLRRSAPKRASSHTKLCPTMRRSWPRAPQPSARERL